MHPDWKLAAAGRHDGVAPVAELAVAAQPMLPAAFNEPLVVQLVMMRSVNERHVRGM